MGVSKRKSLKKDKPIKVESGDNPDSNVTPTSSSSPAVVKDVDEHPISLGNSLVVQYRDGSMRLAKIIERSGGVDNIEYQYYVHYVDFNRYTVKSNHYYSHFYHYNIDVWMNGSVLIE